MRKSMKLIGITGGIGAGKTAVLSLLKELCRCRVLLADDAGNEVKLPGQPCYERLVALLGQEVLAEAFEKALDQLCSLPDEKMVSLLASLALQAAPGGRGRLIFSPQGRAQIGAAVVAKANEALAARGAGALALAQETRPLRGGFILADGPVEVNCSFEAMLRLQREALEKPVAEILFGQDKA